MIELFCRLAVNRFIVNPNIATLGFTKRLFTPTYHSIKSSIPGRLQYSIEDVVDITGLSREEIESVIP